jgi:hypothetical protein
MEGKRPISDDQLLDYLDGNLGQAEAIIVQRELEHNSVLQNRYDELKMLHAYLQNSSLEEPSRNFTQVVMDKLDESPLQERFWIRNSILLLVGVLVVLGITSVLITNGFFDGATSVDLNPVDVPNLIDKPIPVIPSFIIDGKLLVNITMVITMASAFFVLDRMILKPIFRRRLNTTH